MSSRPWPWHSQGQCSSGSKNRHTKKPRLHSRKTDQKAQKKSKARHERGCSIQSAILSPLPTKYQKISMCDRVLEPLSVNDMYNACQRTTTAIDNSSAQIGSGLACFIQKKQETPQCPQLERKSRRQQAISTELSSPQIYPSDEDLYNRANNMSGIKPTMYPNKNNLSKGILPTKTQTSS